MSMQPWKPSSLLTQSGREIRAVGRAEEVSLARVNAAYTVAGAGAARVASLSLSTATFSQIVPGAAPRLGAICDALTVVVVTEVAKFAR